jgi:hypothetical protein
LSSNDDRPSMLLLCVNHSLTWFGTYLGRIDVDPKWVAAGEGGPGDAGGLGGHGRHGAGAQGDGGLLGARHHATTTPRRLPPTEFATSIDTTGEPGVYDESCWAMPNGLRAGDGVRSPVCYCIGDPARPPPGRRG